MEKLDRILTKLFGSRRERQLKRMRPLVEAINRLEPDMQKKTDAELRELTDVFKQRLRDGANLESLLPESFAAVREAARRTIGMRHFDVQLMGGIALFEGNIAEMATGEGKTLVATLPAYLIGLEGKGVHIVTVNDYLAKRDMEWMGPVYEFLGLTVGAIQSDQDPREKYLAYRADITYGTNNEFGFDYLRSNLAVSPEDRPQRELHYAIVDEVDSILIDEARTPLIISGPAEMSPETYYRVNRIVPSLIKGQDFTVDEKERNIMLTEEGIEKAQRLLGIDNMFAEENLGLVHHLDQALRAHHLYQRDVHYVIQDGQVVIVDEFTGRLMPGRRWSDGLHQAIEAKEGVKIERENQTLATITFQNFFRMYDRLAGMTGTADTEAGEFREIYNFDVVVIPTNKPNIRIDEKDQVYRTEAEKFDAIVAQIVECHNNDQPVLVGTISIEKSERLADLLKNRGYWRKKIQKWVKRIKEEVPETKLPEAEKEGLLGFLSRRDPLTVEEIEDWSEKAEKAGEDGLDYHLRALAEAIDIQQTISKGLKVNVLNAKFHEREADIVAQAGRPGAITIATNMAGRGTDIILGGNPEKLIEEELKSLPEDAPESEKEKIRQRIRAECEKGRKRVLEAGGLMIIGSERHESRRIDNQLRGRCGRQGDPGRSRFFLSLEDDLMRLFGGERIQRIANRFGMEEGEVIQHRLVDKSIRKAQKKVEDRNFEIRKYVIKYDDVMNKQREVIYKLRNDLLEGGDGLLRDIFVTSHPLIQKEFVECVPEEIRNQILEEAGAASTDRPLEFFKLQHLQQLVEVAGGDLIKKLLEETDAGLLKQRVQGTDSRLLKKLFESGGGEFLPDQVDDADPEDLKNIVLAADADLVKRFLKGTHPEKAFEDMSWNVFSDVTQSYLDPKLAPVEWNLENLKNTLYNAFNFRPEIEVPDSPNIELTIEEIERNLWKEIGDYYEERKAQSPSEDEWRYLMRFIMLNTLDQKWKDHLLTMDHLKGSIGLRGYGGKDPQQEYSREGFELFQEMYMNLEREVVARMFRVQIRREEAPVNRRERRMGLGGPRGPQQSTGPVTPRRRKAAKIGRNDPCPCGSGKKYKKCCMRKEQAA